MSYEYKEGDVEKYKKWKKEQRAKNEAKQIKKQISSRGFKNWFRMMKAGKTEYQKKVKEFLKTEK